MTRKQYLKNYYIQNKNYFLKKNKEWYEKNSKKLKKLRKIYYLKNKKRIDKQHRTYYQKTKHIRNKKKIIYNKIYQKNHRWANHLSWAKTRCTNKKRKDYKDYGGRGIKCLITTKEIKNLWFRDKAYQMKNPVIHRINSNGNYTIKNCIFIELALHHAKQIAQYNLKNKLIKKWESIHEASRNINISHSSISRCCNKQQLTAGGFIWKII